MTALSLEDKDVLVVGLGIGGLFTATILARIGLSVAVIGSGATATEMSTGCMNFDDELSADQAFGSLARGMSDVSYSFIGGPGHRSRAITNIGTMTEVDAAGLATLRSMPRDGENFAVLGIVGHPDLDPDLFVSMFDHRIVRPHPYWTTLGDSHGNELCQDSFEHVYGDDVLVDELAERLSDIREETICIPPVFNGKDHQAVMDKLERTSGRLVFEPVTPLSIPGRRFRSAMESMAISSGCSVHNGRALKEAKIDGNRVTMVGIGSGQRTFRMEASSLVLATGNAITCGIEIDGRKTKDPLGIFEPIKGRHNRKLSSNELENILAKGAPTDYKGHLLVKGKSIENMFAVGSVVNGTSFPLGKGMGCISVQAWDTAPWVKEAI